MDGRANALLTSPPGWLSSIAHVAYTVAMVYAVGLVAATIARSGTSRGIVRDVLAAAVGAITLGFVGEGIIHGASWPDVFPELLDQPGEPAFPAFRLSVVLAIVSVQAPHLTQPMRRIGRWMIVAAALSTLLLGYSSITGVVAALFCGVTVVALVRVLFGSPEGLPPVGRLRDMLRRLGIDVADLSYDAERPGVVGLARGHVDGDDPVRIKVYGRDAADAQRMERVWRSIWYHRTGPGVAAGRLQQVQHEALGLMLAERASVGTTPVRTAGLDVNGDAVLVTDAPRGHSLRDLDHLDDATLDGLWHELDILHRNRLAHGSIEPWTVWLDDGKVSFIDFEDFAVSASEPRVEADNVAMLAVMAGIVGDERAAASLRRTLGDDGVVAVLPYLQNGVLTRSTGRWLDERDVDLDDLRDQLVEQVDVDPPELAKLRRVTLGSIVMVAFGVVAANAIISQIAEIGFDTLADELASASIGWLVASFVIRMASYTTAWLGISAIVPQPVPIGPTTLLQSAKSFVGLVVPSTVGRVAMDVRFLQKLGTPTAVALAQGPLIGVVGFVVEVCLLLLTMGSMGGALDLDETMSFDVGGLILLAVGVAVVGIAIVLGVPSLRARVVPPAREAFASVRSVVLSPSRLGRVFGGELIDRLAGALSLACVVAAFGADLSFPVVVFVQIGTGLLAGIAPVPGGIGVAEAMLTGLLTAAGLPPEEAFAIAITNRLISSYLPPVLGFFSLNWLKREKYL